MKDDYRKINPVLRKIMKEIYQKRNTLPTDYITNARIERVNDGAFCEIWFLTQGCTHDSCGGCTMCNYGKGANVDKDVILRQVSSRIAELPPNLQELVVSPTGSMLDDEEVSPELRKQILELLHKTECYDFFIETRADTISRNKLQLLKNSIQAERINIEIGVECYNDWVLRNCVNKNMLRSDLEEVLNVIHESGMRAYANIGVGVPFLTEKCSIKLAKRSVRDLFDKGFDCVVLFPYHVKQGTLLEWLWERGYYKCCSLWSIPEVLSEFAPDELERIHISWYRNYYTYQKKIVESPVVGNECMDFVLSGLDEYKNHPCASSLQPLLDFSCQDKNNWYGSLSNQSENIEFDIIEHIYRVLGEAFEIEDREIIDELNYMKKSLSSSAI